MAPLPDWFLSRIVEGGGSKTISLKITTEPSNDAYVACAMSCAGIAAATGFDTWAFGGAAAGARSDRDTVLMRVPAAHRDLVLLPTSALVPAMPAEVPASIPAAAWPGEAQGSGGADGCAVDVVYDGPPAPLPATATATPARGEEARSATVTAVADGPPVSPGIATQTVAATRSHEADATQAPPAGAASGTLPGAPPTATARATPSAAAPERSGRSATPSVEATAGGADAGAAGEIRADRAAADSRVPAAATGGVSVVAGAVGVSVTAPNKAGTTSRIVTAALRCGPDAPDADDDWPDWTSVVLVVPVGGPAEEAAARAAGAALTTCALAAVASAALLLLHRQAAAAAPPAGDSPADSAPASEAAVVKLLPGASGERHGPAVPAAAGHHPWDAKGGDAPRIACARSKAWLRHVGVLYALAHSYYGPSAVEAAVFAAAHGRSGAQVGAGLACVAVRYAALLPAAAAVVRARPADAAAPPPVGSAAFAVFALFEPGRDHRVLSVRALILVDVAVADAVGALTGLQPGTDAGCSATIYAILLVLLAACAYLAARRPYASALEQWAMLGLTGLQAALAAVVIARRRDAAGDGAVALVATAVDAATMLSIAALTAHALWVTWRRRRGGAAAAAADRAGRVEDALLGEVPALAGAPPLPPVRNPLAGGGGMHHGAAGSSHSAGAAAAGGADPAANPLHR